MINYHRMRTAEPALASFLYGTVLANSSLEKCLSFLLGNKLSNATVLGAVQIMGLFQARNYDGIHHE